jgi:hypothetical protein
MAGPAFAQETISLASVWNPAVELTAERYSEQPTVDVASAGWVSADWVLEPAPASFGPGAFYMRNAWRNTYLTYVYEYREGKSLPDGEHPTNAVLMPKMVSPASQADELLANGQVWTFDSTSIAFLKPLPNLVRIRSAYRGFGMAYLTIRQSEDTSFSIRPYVTTEFADHNGTLWLKFKSTHADQTQCVKNLSFTVFDVDWYLGRDMKIQSIRDKLVVVPPSPSAQPALTERKTLGFQSCENSNQRMAAVVRLYGKDRVDQGVEELGIFVFGSTGFFVAGVPGAVAGGVGASYLGEFLSKKPDTVYIGVPGKISVKGTLYDASADETEALLR